ncbi:MAG: hypothetical protein GY845_27890 [Planctomycetes bacterium]|nr:hypothetical protein [Planctomycetota bacterium]
MDDYHHKLLMIDSPFKLLDSPIDMFTFFSGDPDHTTEIMDQGFFPWWTYKYIKGAFWRPLASITHWLDYILWPDTPLLMHAQSILWYGVLAVAVTFLYRRFISVAWVAGLAALFFAIDDAHGTPVGFLANRNAVMATLFGVLTLIIHDKWRRENLRIGLFVGPVLLVASLLSAEAGIATCAYLFAYAVFIDQGTLRQRFTAMIPYVAVVVIWRVIWTYLGYGVEHMGAYIDPLGTPLSYLAAVKNRAPFLLLGQWALPPSDITMMFPKYSMIIWRIALIFLLVVFVIFIPLIWRQRTTRFWTTGMVLSVLPICATFPSDRLLTFVGIGAMGLVAQFIYFVFSNTEERPKLILWRIPALVLACIFILIHLIIAPLVFPVRAAYPMIPQEYAEKLMLTEGMDESVKNQDLIIVNPPITFLMLQSPMMWECNNQPMPRHLRILTSSLFQPVEIYRQDTNTLVVRPAYGFYAYVLDGLFRNKKNPFSVGDRVELTGMTIEIREITNDGQPIEAAFIFSAALEDPSLRWLQHKDGAFVPFTPPAVGQKVVLPGGNLFRE